MLDTTTRTATLQGKATIFMHHARANLRAGVAETLLRPRIEKAIQLADEYPSTITKGRGFDCMTGHWAYIGGSGDTWVNDFEVARARPHHATSQEQYSITRATYPNGKEYFCTCADSWTQKPNSAPYVPGWGTCCKHVLAFLLMRAVGAIEEVTE